MMTTEQQRIARRLGMAIAQTGDLLFARDRERLDRVMRDAWDAAHAARSAPRAGSLDPEGDAERAAGAAFERVVRAAEEG